MDNIDKIEELIYILLAIAAIIFGVIEFKNVYKEPIQWPFFSTKVKQYGGAFLLVFGGIVYLIDKISSWLNL